VTCSDLENRLAKMTYVEIFPPKVIETNYHDRYSASWLYFLLPVLSPHGDLGP